MGAGRGRLFPRAKRGPSCGLASVIRDAERSLMPCLRGEVSLFHPVKVRPSLGFALVPAPRERVPVGESGAVGAYRRNRSMWLLGLRPKADGWARPEGSESDASQKVRPSRRCLGLTRQGAGAVEDLCSLLDESPHLCAFWTVTLPPEAVAAALAGRGSWALFQDRIRRRFGEALKRALSDPGTSRSRARQMPCQWGFVVERQRSGVPHLHFVYRARMHRGAAWVLRTGRLDSLIRNSLRAVFGVDCDVRAAGNVQAIKRGCGRYLSKYLRKTAKNGGGHHQSDALPAGPLDPVRWWGLSSGARATIRALTFALPAQIAGALARCLPEMERRGFLSWRRVHLSGAGAPSVVIGRWRGVEGLRFGLMMAAEFAEESWACYNEFAIAP